MRLLFAIIAMAVLSAPAVAQAHTTPKVPDAAAATRIGEAALTRVYGKKQIEAERPFTAKLKNGVWTVAGTVRCKDRKGNPSSTCFGGAGVVQIEQKSGHIVSIAHYK